MSELRQQVQDLTTKSSDAEQQSGATATLLLEKDALVATLRAQISDLRQKSREGKVELEAARAKASKLVSLESTQAQADESQKELMALKQDLASKASLVTRLRQVGH